MSTNLSRVRMPRFAEVAVERAKLTVVPARMSRAPRTPFIILVIGMLAGGVMGLLAFNTNMQAKAFEATRLQAKATTLQAQQQKLALELDDLRNPQHLASRAKEMGMVPPTSPAFLRLSDGKVLGEPVPAGAGAGVPIESNPMGKPVEINPPPIIIKVPAPAPVVAAPAVPEQTSPTTGAASPNPPARHGKKKQHR